MNKSIVLTIVLLVASLSSINIVNASTEPPLPYCDKVFNQSCYDRQDTDDITGLAPCNDGSQVPDYHDCPDATESRNITAFIHFNREAIKEDTRLSDMQWTVDGKNATNSYYDMSDAVYGDSSEPDDDVLSTGYSDELMVAGNASKICLEEDSEDPDYKSCDYIKADTTEMHFTYPGSWQPITLSVNANTEIPLPYCDKVEDLYPDIIKNCHDRQDTDDITGLAPCNDGSQVPDYHDCPDATESRNITAFIHYNEQAIKEDDSGNLDHNGQYIVDGKNYSDYWHHDLIEALYPDEADAGPNYDYVTTDELMVDLGASQICFETIDYRSCNQINDATTEIHFSYPASWVPG